MNILIYSTRLDTGGIATVSSFLANAWIEKGHKVAIAVLGIITDDVREKLHPSIPVYVIKFGENGKSFTTQLKDILHNEKTELVINQYGLPWKPAKILYEASRKLDVKKIAVYHSDPSANARLTCIDKELEKPNGIIKRAFLNIKRWGLYQVTRKSMRYVYNRSDAYVLLSPVFRKKFSEFTGVKTPKKLFAIPNPVTLQNTNDWQLESKEKMVLYVGRVDTTVKRVDRVIQVWRLIEKDNPDWRLVVVGDGEGLEEIKKLSERYELKRVSFEGFRDPTEYYKKASILLLTSDFEGFGLVLVEGMSFGVIPVAYGSYDSVFDIIQDGHNGFVIMPVDGRFSEESMATRVVHLIKDKDLRDKMTANAVNISNLFSKESILTMWEDLFETLKLNN